MVLSSLDSDAVAVLSRYPSYCRQGTLTSLGNHGGFSGAAVWRIDSPAGSMCLRVWPIHETLPRLLHRHHLMTQARQSGLSFVPIVYTSRDSTTVVELAKKLWELSEWLPGQADFHERPSLARLQAACTALAQLHLAWHDNPRSAIGYPAVHRRLSFVGGEWLQFVRSGWNPLVLAAASDPLRPIVERAWSVLPLAIEQVPQRLQRWLDGRPRVQPCLCDVWHDHLLFEGERLTGMIDYGSVKIDHVAVDLSRMLGSLVADDAAAWEAGLQAYRSIAPLTVEEEALAHALDETGIVLGVANWLRWLYVEKRTFADRSAVARRLTELVERLEATSVNEPEA